jgi:hypothetical protein
VNRTIGGLPLIYWIGALGLGIGVFAWIKKKGGAAGATSPATAGKGATANSFTQAQEVQDFQIFSSLTGAQQASDLNFLSEVAGLFSGGSSTGTGSTTGGSSTGTGSTTGSSGGSSIPSPPSTGTAPPATTPITYGAPGQAATTTFSQAPPAGTGYVWTGSQWVIDTGQGIGYVPA